MNYKVVFNMLGWTSYFEGAFLLLPLLVAMIYGEDVVISYLLSIMLCIIVGSFFRFLSPKQTSMHAKEGYVTVAACWILLSALGAVPFVITGEIPFYIDALFETVSGFTTTGASVIPDLSKMSHGSLFWRSFTHWIGGMGILVFMMAILPNKGNGSVMHMMRAESPGPTVSKLVPKIKQTALILYEIYFALTIIEIVLLLIAGMPMFDSIVLSMGTAGTGGFGVYADSLGSYTVLQQGIVTVFMILFGVNFTFYYLILIKKVKQAFAMAEVRAYLLTIGLAILFITWNVYSKFDSVWMAFHHTAFQVGSIITTTGYATTDFNQWPSFSKAILVTLMFIGACAGSTGGGIKVSRILLLFKGIKNEIISAIHPRSVQRVKMDGHSVDNETIRVVNAYLALYIVIFVVSVLIVSLDEFDLITNFTAVAATLNNIGPGLEVVGPMGGFGGFSPLAKLVMIFDMLAGRLELFPMILLCTCIKFQKRSRV